MIAATSLLLTSGATSRILTAYLTGPTARAELTSEDLGSLPIQIGQWNGLDVALDEAVIRAADVDAHVNREYTSPNEAVALFIAYGIRARDLMPHRPEVCYPSAGWTLKGSDASELLLSDGSKLNCRIYKFERGALTRQAVCVLNYYVVDGRYSPDVSLLRSKVLMGPGGVRYVAQVQITASVIPEFPGDRPDRAVRRFAADSALLIRQLLPDTDALGPVNPTR